MNGHYVVNQNGERVAGVAVLVDIEEYERMVARQSGEPPDDDCGDFDPEEAERRILRSS